MKPRHQSILVIVIATLTFIAATLVSPASAEPGMTFTVNASADAVDILAGDGVCETAPGNGICTLRAAIMEANAHSGTDTIYIPAATYQLTIPGANEDGCASGDLDITESVIISGGGAGTSIIDAQGLGDRVLDIAASASSVSISGIQITGGSTTLNGGGIKSTAPLELSDVSISSNDADILGGGIFSTNTLSLTNVEVISNTTAGDGGGINANGYLTSVNGLVRANTAGGNGGGYYLLRPAQMINAQIENNTAVWYGGGIYNLASLSIWDSEISSNTAYAGGGINNHSMIVVLNLSHTSFVNNHSTVGGGGLVNANGGSVYGHELQFDQNTANVGGAISNETGNIYISLARFSNNSAKENGGAIWNASNSTFELTHSTIFSNTASLDGGGILNQANITLKGVTVSANHARQGGGIRNEAMLRVENCTISGNSATSSGGGIYNLTGSYTKVYNTTITLNMASATGFSGFGGGVYNDTSAIFSFRNTILYANHHNQGLIPYEDDCYGTLYTAHYNLIGALDNCILDSDQDLDLIGVDPLLGVLAENGGSTQTHALQPGSPAIDAGNPEGCIGFFNDPLTADQRGHPRPWDGDGDGTPQCDIGAFEYPFSIVFLPLTLK